MLRLVRTSASPMPLELDGITPDRLASLTALDVAMVHGSETKVGRSGRPGRT